MAHRPATYGHQTAFFSDLDATRAAWPRATCPARSAAARSARAGPSGRRRPCTGAGCHDQAGGDSSAPLSGGDVVGPGDWCDV